MGLVHKDHVVEQFPAQCSNEALNIRILPWASVGYAHFFDATTFKKRRNCPSEKLRPPYALRVYKVLVRMSTSPKFAV